MICNICGSSNIATTAFLRDDRDEIIVEYTCHNCGFSGIPEDKLEIRNKKINKIKKKCIM